MRLLGPDTPPSSRLRREGEAPAIPLNIPLPMLTYIIAKAREFDVGLEAGADTEPGFDNGSDGLMADDLEREFLPGRRDDTPYDDLRSALDLLNAEQLVTLVALLWVGRGDYDRREWRQARRAATEILEERDGVDYLCGTPLAADYLGEGLAALGHDLEEDGALVL